MRDLAREAAMNHSLRRQFLIALSVLLAAPLAYAQKPDKIHRIGVLGVASAAGYARQAEALRRGLRDLGYVEGKNLVIEFRWADGNAARLPELAAELVRLNPEVIVTSGPGNAVAKRATGTIPIVMAVSTNAVESGLVASLARPGGNVTGSSSFSIELSTKQLALLKETFPRLARVGLLVYSGYGSLNAGLIQALEEAARVNKVQLQVVEVGGTADFEPAFAALAKGRAEGLVVSGHTVFVAEAPRIAQLARTNRLPVIGFVEIADAGGLLAYGVDFPERWERAANFVDRILKGANPAELPVEQPMRFEVVVNLATAKALGVTIPSAVRLRANRVIE
jgi:putative ABC transport system substrate-binding protein